MCICVEAREPDLKPAVTGSKPGKGFRESAGRASRCASTRQPASPSISICSAGAGAGAGAKLSDTRVGARLDVRLAGFEGRSGRVFLPRALPPGRGAPCDSVRADSRESPESTITLLHPRGRPAGPGTRRSVRALCAGVRGLRSSRAGGAGGGGGARGRCMASGTDQGGVLLAKHNYRVFRFLSPLHLTRVVTSYTYIDSLADASAPIGRYRDTSPHVLDTRPAPAPTWLTLAHAPSCAPHAPTSLRCPPGCGLPQAQHTLRLGPGASLAQPHPRPSSEPSSARPRNAAHAVPHSRAPSTANHG